MPELSKADLRAITIEEDRDVIESKTTNNLNILGKYIPIIKWLPTYTQFDAISDLISGITLGLMIIPQSIAYAALAGLSAQYGLYSAFGGSLIYVFFGTAKEVSIGPTSLMALLTLEFTRNMSLDFVVLLGFLSGCVELLMGLFNLGFLVDFISMPVTAGFTSATSVIIIIGQLPGLFGLRYESSSNIDSVVQLFQHISDIRLGDTVMGVTSIILLLSIKKLTSMNLPCQRGSKQNTIMKKSLWFLSLGRNALVILIMTITASMMLDNGKSPVMLSGKVKSGLPSFSLPPFSTQVGDKTYSFLEMCSQLGIGIIVLPVVAVLANVSIAKAFANGKTVDASQEMRALGMCNIFGGMVQSLPTCGAFTRSAVSHASGVRTPLSGIYSGVMTLLALSFLTPYFYYIPRSSLAAVLISAVMFMIDWSIVVTLYRGSRKGMVAALFTFVACIFSVEFGLLLGIMMNVLYLVHAWARPSISVTKCTTEDGDEYILIKPDIGLYYPAVDFLRTKINEVATKDGRNVLPLVLDCESFKGIDYTAVKGIEAMINDFEMKKQQILLIRFEEKVFEKIELLGGIKNLRHSETEDGIIENLFSNRLEMTRIPTAPVLKPMEYVTLGDSGLANFRSNEKGAKEALERESLLTEYKAVIAEFETADKAQLKNRPLESCSLDKNS